MTDDDLERLAQLLQQATPPPQGLGQIIPWQVLAPSSKAFWREKVRQGQGDVIGT